MSRLTYRDEYGDVRPEFGYTLADAVEKLAHYEDLEEQGLLLELPCKVGDTVYMIQRRYTKCSKHQEYRDEYNCQGCEELVCDSHIEHYIQPLNSAPIDWIVKMDNQFGKTVFLTKEEAESKLAELKGTEE
jgi:hypothetical protein